MVTTEIFYSNHGPFPEPRSWRPLIVCDVDEVVLGFVSGLELWLSPRGWRLARDSYALNGNIRDFNDVKAPAAKVGELIAEFFAECANDLTPLPGALDALALLAACGDVIFLTNLPASSATARRANLDRLGLTHPLLVNEGPKGPALARLVSKVSAPVAFLDDSPDHIVSAIKETPEIATVHLVPDAGFRRNLVAIKGVGLFTGNWSEAVAYILGRIQMEN